METARPLGSRAKAVYDQHPEAYSAVATVGVGVLLLLLGVVPVWEPLALVDAETVWVGWHYAILAGAFAALLVRRRHPMLALTAGAALFVVDTMLGGTLGMLLVLFDLIYAAAFWGSVHARAVLRVLIAVAVAVSAILPIVLGRPLQTIVLFALQTFAILATPYWWASAVRRGRELAASEAARADDAQRLAVLDRERAVRAERSRMAQDLHDVIAGNLSAVAIHSEASLSREPDGRRDRAALEAVRAASVEGLEQMRSMIGLLRTGDDARVAPLRLADLDDLVADSGLDVEIEGAPPTLPTAADQAAARIIAESLTNAAKHRPGARVAITFAADDDGHVVRVRSSGGRAVAAAGTGHGLSMMRERAEGIGGSLTAGPAGGGGPGGAGDSGGSGDPRGDWIVTAHLPGRTA
ncbi:sensor histidine kinase [Agromyces sp. CFH 90414]|uniref:histidine kinase n=1 Tax=Agromyces agglutinans TaxID=2662258 RepID=A0A6I2F746_9MICO|nr:histidine kinase [Agromyces agglutinans]MRG59607.1 sensor histidine kinase [Agromyces agglutinans]